MYENRAPNASALPIAYPAKWRSPISRRPARRVSRMPDARRAASGSVSGIQRAEPSRSRRPNPASTTNRPRQSVIPSSAPPSVGARIGPIDTAPMSAA